MLVQSEMKKKLLTDISKQFIVKSIILQNYILRNNLREIFCTYLYDIRVINPLPSTISEAPTHVLVLQLTLLIYMVTTKGSVNGTKGSVPTP